MSGPPPAEDTAAADTGSSGDTLDGPSAGPAAAATTAGPSATARRRGRRWEPGRWYPASALESIPEVPDTAEVFHLAGTGESDDDADEEEVTAEQVLATALLLESPEDSSIQDLATAYMGFHNQLLLVMASGLDIAAFGRMSMSASSTVTAPHTVRLLQRCEARLRVASMRVV
ncbi:MAG: hypothetical protein GY772_18055 [bacterium]|nr:hypothetical protein [bacterium]